MYPIYRLKVNLLGSIVLIATKTTNLESVSGYFLQEDAVYGYQICILLQSFRQDVSCYTLSKMLLYIIILLYVKTSPTNNGWMDGYQGLAISE